MQFLLKWPPTLHTFKYYINSHQCDIPVVPFYEGISSKAQACGFWCAQQSVGLLVYSRCGDLT